MAHETAAGSSNVENDQVHVKTTKTIFNVFALFYT